MDWKTLLFSPTGRINRKRYWLTLIVTDLALMVVYMPLALTLKPNEPISVTQSIFLIVVGVIALVISYVGIILAIKRFHDRDKSGWWVLISLVPIIGGFWLLIECGFLRGTTGMNRFGPDPLAPHDDIVKVFGDPERQVTW